MANQKSSVFASRKSTPRTTSVTKTKAEDSGFGEYAHEPETFNDLDNVTVRPVIVDENADGLLRSLVMAFCRYTHDQDVEPMPNQPSGDGSTLLFRVGTNGLVLKTVANWVFRERDWLQVDPYRPDDKIGYGHGDIIVGVADRALQLLEIRAKDAAKPTENLTVVELRRGKEIDKDAFLIIGLVREYRRSHYSAMEASREAFRCEVLREAEMAGAL